MAVAMSLLYQDRAYYYEAKENTNVLVGRSSAADLVIHNLEFDLSISVKGNEANIRLGETKEITALFDQFVVLDNEAHLAVYLTEVIDEEYRVRLPRNGEWLLGRSSKLIEGKRINQIIVDLPFVSATHCKIVRNNGLTTIIDNGSKNGLFVNGKRIQQANLCDGDVLSIFTVQIVLKGDSLVFKNVGTSFVAEELKGQLNHKEAPKKAVSSRDYQFSRSPRMIANVESSEIILEKPPQTSGRPQINWINVLVMPGISVVLMLVMVIAMGMNAVMLIMSGTMSIISALAAILNYRKQKSKHEGMEGLVDKKYRDYLSNVFTRIDNNKKKQLTQLITANPDPNGCVDYAKNKDRRLWERSTEDQDFLSIRIGAGTIPSALTARYKQAEVVITESELEVAAKEIAESSRYVEQAPILCDLAKGKLIGILGNRADEEQLIRNMIVEIATAHSYDEVKLVVLASEDDIGLWGWIRWIPHCANNQMTERYIFTSVDDAEETLDSINDILNRRSSKDNEYGQLNQNDNTPHYVFVVLHRQMIEKHPIRKHLFSANKNGCSCLLVYDSISYLPKECNDIIEVRSGNGEIYDRHNSSEKTKFIMDRLSQENADAFARALAPLRINVEGQGAVLPNSVSFLKGYGVSKPEQLDIASRWKNAKTYKSLAVPIAATAGGDSFAFDIHEKRHGVNGIVAGMPGSGKTEMVQTWLLSLAVNYSPQDVSFVLIDFKGTGMIAPFRNLPHLAGSISNLDTNIDRNLIAIQSEVHRRETIIDKYSNKNIKNINDLNKAFDKGLVPEKLPILLVVIDEYAEFKKIYPDFGAEIDSLTSKGRALGIFVVLMTQKPSGVVSAKSEDNIKFRWCLRVANYSASREMLGKPDAARISNPGRAFIKVGEDDVFEQVQSFWSGAPYIPDKNETKDFGTIISHVRLNGKRVACEQLETKPVIDYNESEIDAVVGYITRFCEGNNIRKAAQIWTEKLPERVSLMELLSDGFNGKHWPEKDCTSSIGLVDDPGTQQQYPLQLDLAKTGHTIVYGAPVTGKTTLLQTVIMALAMTHTPDKASIYVMDFGGWNMNVLRKLPHIGGIANDNEPERLKKLVALLQDILEERKQKFSSVGVGNIGAYRETTGDKLPDVVLAVDNFGAVLKLYPELDGFFVDLTGNGANYGVYLVATTLGANSVPMKITQNIKYALALQMIEKIDYTYTVGKVSSMLPVVAGRGYAKGNLPLEFQTALPASGNNDKSVSENVKKIAEAMDQCWDGNRPASIPEMPETIPYGSVNTTGICLGLSTQKVLPVNYDPEKQHFLLISGTAKSGKSNLLQVAAKQIKQKMGGRVCVFDTQGNNLQMKQLADAYLTTAAEIDAFIEKLRPEMQKRYDERKANAANDFEPLIVVVDNYTEFFKAVSNDTISRLLAMIKIGEGLGIYLLLAGDAYELSSLINKGEAVSLAAARGTFAVMLGGCMNDHAGIPTRVSYTQKGVTVKEHEGYFINGDSIIQFKAMSSTGEVKA